MGEAQEATKTPKEWSELHNKNVALAMKLFKQWMLSTRTQLHEERLRRRGSLSTTLPVCFSASGKGLIEKELRTYGVRVAHRSEGTVINVDTAARSSFQERHAELWRSAPFP